MAEDISEFVQAEQTSYTFYNEDGEVVTEDVGVACAYIASVKDKESYYIKTFRGVLFDPQGMDSNIINAIATKFSKVQQKTFDFYIDYLKSKERNHYTWAERSNIDV